MEKKQYIKPNVEAYQINTTLILAGSGSSQQSFSYGGGSEWPWYDARAKLNNIDMSERYDYDDYFDIDW